MADRFEDNRGVIQDLLGSIDAVTEIFTKAGCVRGNHVHENTVQYTYVVSGLLFARHGTPESHTDDMLKPGDMLTETAGVPHAWKAMEDTWVLVFTRGPRSGEAYESDTKRLSVPLIEG
jgi:quercetin dioxygenase-like cupin family protein